MGRFLKWIFIFGAFLAVISFGFTLYANFLLDYSLNSLESTLSVTDKTLALKSPVVKNLYKKLVDDISLEETADESEIKEVVLLGLASRSMDESIERAGYERATVYLSQITEAKSLNRSNLLKFTDKIYGFLQQFYDSVLSLAKYIQTRVFSKFMKKEKKLNYTDLVLLSDAETAAKNGELAKAVRLYKQYLAIYPRRTEWGYVSLSLSRIYIQQGNFDEAKSLLKRVQLRYVGRAEQKLAASFLRRIRSLQLRQSDIEDLRQRIGEVGTSVGSIKEQNLSLKLGLAYFGSYDLERAEKTLLNLTQAENFQVRAKAQFYLSRVYKEKAEYEKAIPILQDLLSESHLDSDLQLGIHAELADHFYLNREPEKAAESYEILGREVQQAMYSVDVARKATESLTEIRKTQIYGDWSAISNIEQANIYLFDFGDASRARTLLQDLDLDEALLNRVNLTQAFHQSSALSLRDRAFDALRSGSIHAAFDMFKRNIELFPRDGWSYAGMATTLVLLGNLEEAEVYAQKGLRFTPDEYTLSILAFVEGYREDFVSAIKHYEEALALNKHYMPAKFNLGCMFLETGRYAEAYSLFEALESKLTFEQGYMQSKVFNNLGYASWMLGNSQQAKSFFERALKKTPSFVLAAKNLRKLAVGEAPEMLEFKDE